jgi:hypothetical protein
MSLLLGAISCTFILSVSNATVVFLAAAICAVVGAVIVIVFVDESVQHIERSSTCESIRSILSTTHIRDMIKTTFKPRMFYDRWILLLLILMVALNRFAMDGIINVGYLFERVRFNWTLEDHNSHQAASIAMAVFGTAFAMLVLKRMLGFSEMFLICLSIFSNLIDYSLRAFAYQTWQMYAISLLSFMKVIVHPLCRSLISSTVSQNEIGKAMSFTTSFESIATFIAPPIFISVYDATYTTFPGGFLLICGVMCLINTFIAFCVMIMKSAVAQVRKNYVEIS